MSKKQRLLLIAILLVGFLLRFIKVAEVPPSLNWDEASIGYNAYSVLKTGKDEWGELLPVHFRSFGEYKLPVQIYASIPGIALLGLNELGVRITPVIYGTLTLLVAFFLARAVFKNGYVGLLAAFLLAISPWHIHLTRGSFESSFAVFWITLGLWFLVKGFEDHKWLIFSMIPFAISVYTYNSARVFTPLFLAVILLIYFKDFLKIKKHVILSIVVFTVMMIPVAQFVLSGEGSARYKLVSVTDDPGLTPRINQNRGNSKLPQPLPKVVHNKYTYVSYYSIQNYLSHFSPDFLFISGAPHKQHHVQKIGELYVFQAPFLLLGLIALFRRKEKYRWLLVSWILLVFIPVALTNDSIPHALRTLIAAPAYQLITGLGLWTGFEYLKKKNDKAFYLSFSLLAVVVAMSVGYYLKIYYTQYSYLYSRDWQYGYKQAVDYIKKEDDKFDKIVFTRHYGEPHIFTLFYLKYDPLKFQNDPNLDRFETYDWVRVLKFDKYYFPDLGDNGTRYEDIIAQDPKSKTLFIGKSGDFPPGVNRLKTVYFLNGDQAFEIVEYGGR